MSPSDIHLDRPPVVLEGKGFPVEGTFTSENAIRDAVDTNQFVVNGGHREELDKDGLVSHFFELNKPKTAHVDAFVKIYGSIDESSMQKPQLMNADTRNNLVDIMLQELSQGLWHGNMQLVPRYEAKGMDTEGAVQIARDSFRYAQRQAESANYLFGTAAGRRVLEQTPSEYRTRMEKFISDVLGPKDENGTRHPPSYEEKFAEINVS